MPTEKYAHAPEILEHCQRIGKQFELYDNALFHTEVTGLDMGRRRGPAGSSAPTGATRSRPSSSPWAPGPLHVPKLPGIPGIDDFRGHSFHTSRWDYELHRRRSGRRADGPAWPTSASASSAPVPPRCSASPTWPGPAASCTSSSGRRRRSTCGTTGPPTPTGSPRSPPPAGSSGGSRTSPPTRPAGCADEDLVMDGWTDLARRVRSRIHGAPTGGAHGRGDDGGVRGLRLREDGGDPGPGRRHRRGTPTRPERLKAWYRQLCKRPCFHDEYLQAFNEPGTHLVDTDGKGVERITDERRGGGRGRVRARLHHLRLGLRGRAPSSPAGPATTRSGATACACPSSGPTACAPSTASTCTASPTCSSCSPPRAPT